MAKKILPPAELTRLHYLTDEEADLIQDYRLLGAGAKECTRIATKTHSNYYVEPTGGNVVGIRRPAD